MKCALSKPLGEKLWNEFVHSVVQRTTRTFYWVAYIHLEYFNINNIGFSVD